jgi:hypothetical protein
MEKDKTLELQRVQSAIYAQFPDECERLGFTPTEPIEEKWKKIFGLHHKMQSTRV